MLGRSSEPLVEAGGKQGGDLAVCYCGSRSEGPSGKAGSCSRVGLGRMRYQDSCVHFVLIATMRSFACGGSLQAAMMQVLAGGGGGGRTTRFP